MIRTPTWPSSWKARIRWSGIARPMWMSGEVTSIPSFTRSGRPSASFASSPPSGSTSTAFRMRSERATELHYRALWRCSGKGIVRPSGAVSASSGCWRCSPCSALLGFSAFVFGLLTRSRPRSPELEPAPPAGAQSRTPTSTRATATRSSRSCAARRRGSSCPSQEISPRIKQAIVAIEDKRFYEHHGIDVRGIVRARLGRRHQPGRRPGRLDDHAAVREERDQRQRTDARRAS